jgi:FkbH-like protein
MMQKNIESIRGTLPEDTYKIVVVDNGSDDGVAEWLAAQTDILLICNEENRGFPCACNQGVEATCGTEYEDYDIFLLNNDTRLAANSLFWLRMGLYENEKIGAVGSCSNYAGNNQDIDIVFDLPNDYLEYGAKRNIPLASPYEDRVRLSGFAMLIRRSLWDDIGGMDERFSPGYFEDDDLCMQIALRGFRMFVCKNSFIYHAGSQSFASNGNIDNLLESHRQMFIEKYGFDIFRYAEPDGEGLESIPYSADDEFNMLQIGCGLGADLKFSRTLYPAAHAVGMECDETLRKIAQGTEIVFGSTKELTDTFNGEVFNGLKVSLDEWVRLGTDERNAVRALCRPDCHILPQNNLYESIPFDKIKLIIWDMDNTFWKGVLSEESVGIEPENILLIRQLTDRGIINSISSKNNEEDVMSVLEASDIASHFVFCDINWENKGEQINRKISSMGLRAENVLFIDDDIRNLEEAKCMNVGIMTAEPDIIPLLKAYVHVVPVSDTAHKRLAQYRILEKKAKEQTRFASKESFLYDSDIRISICKNCFDELDRIAELLARTNQLNFTKVRSSRDEVLRLISNDWMDCGYVKVRDKYGEYGIVGFYCVNIPESRLEHFAFSCRVIGMRVEQYVYSELGCPEIDIVQPVAAELKKDEVIPWIKKDAECASDNKDADIKNDTRVRILLKGPCDMSAIEGYLIGGKITTEFNFVNPKGFITAGQNHSMHIWESAHCSDEELKQIFADAPFITQGDFDTMLFKRAYDVICYSLLPDCHAGLYRHKETGMYVSFGSVNFDLTDAKNMKGYIDGSIVNHGFDFTEEIIKDFFEKWEFVGTTAVQDIIRNLDYMYENAPGEPEFIFLLGSETEYDGDNAEFANHAKRHREVNRCIEEYAEGRDRIKLINFTDFISSQEDYEDCINHFSRNVYYNLATEIVAHINAVAGRRKKW